MIKHYCDICNKEINPKTDMYAEFNSIEFKLVEKTQQARVPNSYLICAKCKEEIKKTINKLKKENE